MKAVFLFLASLVPPQNRDPCFFLLFIRSDPRRKYPSQIQVLFEMVGPAIERRPKPCRDRLGYGGVQRHQPLPPAQPVQPLTTEPRSVKDAMDIGPPHRSIF